MQISWMTFWRWRIIPDVRQRNSSNMRWSGCRSGRMLFITFMFCKGKLTPMLSMIFFYYPQKNKEMPMFNLALQMDQSGSLYTFEYNWPLNSNLNLFFSHISKLLLTTNNLNRDEFRRFGTILACINKSKSSDNWNYWHQFKPTQILQNFLRSVLFAW